MDNASNDRGLVFMDFENTEGIICSEQEVTVGEIIDNVPVENVDHINAINEKDADSPKYISNHSCSLASDVNKSSELSSDVESEEIIDVETVVESNDKNLPEKESILKEAANTDNNSSEAISNSSKRPSEQLLESKSTTHSDHGYCKSTNPGNIESIASKLPNSEENAPVEKKVKLNSVLSQQQPANITFPTNYDSQKQRMDPCPPLSKEHIDLLLSYLANPKLCVSEQLFLMQIRLSKFPRIKRYSVARQLERWSKCLTKRKVNGQLTLCLRPSEKIILPMEKYVTVIKEAHQNIGCFLKRKEKGEFNKRGPKSSDHNSYHRTLTLIESEYGVGGREFGMSKFSIYEYVANCRECTAHQKRLPSLSKVLGSNEVPKSMAAIPFSTFENSTGESRLDIGDMNVSNDSMGEDSDAPVSMIWEKPSPGSIWHNQSGLASEMNPYAKLLGVIQEIGLDLVASSQGDIPSKSKFLTKLYCATRLIQEMKTSCEKNETNTDTQFMIDYLKLQEMYIEIGKLDLFLYDVNLLAIKYNLTKSELFMQIVNSCVSKFSKTNKPVNEELIYDTPIDLPKHLIDSEMPEEETGSLVL